MTLLKSCKGGVFQSNFRLDASANIDAKPLVKTRRNNLKPCSLVLKNCHPGAQPHRIFFNPSLPVVRQENEDFLKKVIAIYPGSFDPPTNGHLDLIERGSKIFDELIVAILRNPEKSPLFSLGERRAMLEALTADLRNVQVDVFDGLTVDYAARVKAGAVLRGIRALSDYEYELQMAMMNRKLQPELETVFMMPAEQYSYLSSRLVREVAKLGGSIRDLVPEMVERRLREKLDPAIKLQDARKMKTGKRA